MFPLAIVLAACTRAAAPAPAEVPRQVAPPPPERSQIVVPIRTTLAPLVPEIESRVPKAFAGKARERGIDVRYDVRRDPISIRMVGQGLHASTRAHYALEACRGRFPCVSCGYGEARRVAEITFHSALEWDPSWRIRSKTRLLPVHYARRCAVTWLDIDITRRFVAPVIEQQLGAVTRIIDRMTPSLANIRPQAAQIWKSLQEPIALADRTWLLLEPVGVSLTPIEGSGLNVSSTLTLVAQTRVIVGNRPVVNAKPLPPLRVGGASANAIRVPLDLELPYDEASRMTTQSYAKRTYQIGGKSLTIESIRVAPAGEGRLLVEAMIDYRGGFLRNYRGTIFLEGTPRFDPATSSVVVPDLDYSIAPGRRDFLSRIADRAVHESVRDALRERARFPLGGRTADLRRAITAALNRELAPGVVLRGRADHLEPVSVTPLADRISIRVVATGAAEVVVKP